MKKFYTQKEKHSREVKKKKSIKIVLFTCYIKTKQKIQIKMKTIIQFSDCCTKWKKIKLIRFYNTFELTKNNI